jgi:hypothetical protein
MFSNLRVYCGRPATERMRGLATPAAVLRERIGACVYGPA